MSAADQLSPAINDQIAFAPPWSIDKLRAIMARLRDPVLGCPWDVAQNFASIAPYTIEEAYEVADAITRGDVAALCDELGDLLLQTVFHAQIAAEARNGAQSFTFDDVVTAICDKLVRRHPHVFGPAGSTASSVSDWEAIKAAERGPQSTLDGVAIALPALTRADKLQRRAARVGFDWPDASGPRAKIDEELAEYAAAATPAEVDHEIGDLLFSLVNLARHRGVDPEAALRAANGRFEARFALVETLAAAPLDRLDIDALGALWDEAKRRIATGDG